jgi:1-acyl-sn-glycerol-3-phosphate acyltransferase
VLPPRWIRRTLVAPLIPVLTVLLLVSLPITLLVAATASTFLPGRLRGLRVLYFLLVYLITDTLAILWLFTLWVASGFGGRIDQPRWQDRHYALMRTYLAVLVKGGSRVFRIGFDVDADEFTREVATTDQPVLVFSRHAGIGDSFLLVHAVLQSGRKPRIVLKSVLQWAPVIDIGLNRVPCFFVERGAPRGTGTRAIRELAATTGPRDALIIFPEGQNYTPQRRLLSIDKLEEQGRHDEAEAAREMRHVLTPRSGGAIAALEGAPAADVAFVAHAGLEHFTSAVDLWRGIPLDSDLAVKAWRVPRGEIPRAREAQDAWLQWWWRRIDAWIIDHYGEEAVPDAVVEAVADQDIEPAPE